MEYPISIDLCDSSANCVINKLMWYFYLLHFNFIVYLFVLLFCITNENKTLQFVKSLKAVKLLWDLNHLDYRKKVKRNVVA